MKKTPLFLQQLAHNAATEIYGDWELARHYGDPDAEIRAARARAVLFDLSPVGKALWTGENARRLCNGMFSNNIKKMRPGQGNRSVMCDDRGRVLGLLDLYCLADDRFLMVLDGVDTAWFEKKYEMYAVLDDVEVELYPESPWLLSLQGPGAEGVLRALGLPVPAGDHDHTEVPSEAGQGLRVMRKDRTGLGGFDLLVPDAALATVFEAAVAAGAQLAGQETLEALRVADGRARWPQDGTDKSMVHELRYNTECCAFDKGCYVGQEVINRIDVKGQVIKRLMGIVPQEDALPPLGAEVLHGVDVVGTITSAVRVLGKPLALGVLRKAVWEPGTPVVIRAAGRDVPALVSDLPFSRETGG